MTGASGAETSATQLQAAARRWCRIGFLLAPRFGLPAYAETYLTVRFQYCDSSESPVFAPKSLCGFGGGRKADNLTVHLIPTVSPGASKGKTVGCSPSPEVAPG